MTLEFWVAVTLPKKLFKAYLNFRDFSTALKMTKGEVWNCKIKLLLAVTNGLPRRSSNSSQWRSNSVIASVSVAIHSCITLLNFPHTNSIFRPHYYSFVTPHLLRGPVLKFITNNRLRQAQPPNFLSSWAKRSGVERSHLNITDLEISRLRSK